MTFDKQNCFWWPFLIIQFESKELKFKMLNNRKKISKNEGIRRDVCYRIYFHPDSSCLVQKEEYRLRKKLHEVKNANPEIPSCIHSGVFYSVGAIIDRADVRSAINRQYCSVNFECFKSFYDLCKLLFWIHLLSISWQSMCSIKMFDLFPV